MAWVPLLVFLLDNDPSDLLLLEAFDHFRQPNAEFNVFGHRFQDLFPTLRSYIGVRMAWANEEPPAAGRWDHPPELSVAHMISIKISGEMTLPGRKLVTTETGFLGLAPEATSEDDVVVVLYG